MDETFVGRVRPEKRAAHNPADASETERKRVKSPLEPSPSQFKWQNHERGDLKAGGGVSGGNGKMETLYRHQDHDQKTGRSSPFQLCGSAGHSSRLLLFLLSLSRYLQRPIWKRSAHGQ